MEDDVEEIFDIFEVLDHIDHRYERKETENFFETLEDRDFVKRFRVSKEFALEILEQIEMNLEFPDNRDHPVSPISQLLITLRFYATGCFLLTCGDFFNVSPATVSRVVKRVSEAIATLRPRYVKLPNLDEVVNLKRDFYRIARFPNIVGTLDCTHIKIQSPGGPESELFRNRKGYFSINVQTISDPDLRIQNVVARCPESTHDSIIFNNSEVSAIFEGGRYGNGMLLGDSGYPLRNYLLTPYLNPNTPAQQRYNNSHILTRNTVERQYGVWKRRFPILSYGIRLKLSTAVTVIVACAVLHNICINRGEELPDDNPLIEDEIIQLEMGEMNDLRGNLMRDTIVNNYFN